MQPLCNYEEGALNMAIKGCTWIIVARERLHQNILYGTNPPRKKLRTPWGFVPHCHFLFLFKHRGNITHTPHTAWQKTDSHFEYQTFWDTHHGCSISFRLSKMSDRGHTLFPTPPTLACVQLYSTVDQTFSYFLSLLLSPIKKKKKVPLEDASKQLLLT